MKTAEGKIGRAFVLRLEDGDRLPDCVERFAEENGVRQAYCALVGGVGSGRIVVGPKDAATMPPEPVLIDLPGASEAAAVGTIFPDESGKPRLHMHATFGRGESVRTGCIRPGIDVWTIGEFLIFELTGLDMLRKRDAATGFELLSPR
jgi:predicted DNA-binding protein with PD1-like motif